MICTSPFGSGIGCRAEIVPVTSIRINSSHHLCTTCAAIACSKYGIKHYQLRDLEWAISAVQRDMIKKKTPGPVPPERVRAAIDYIEQNPGLLKMPDTKETP